MEPKTKAETITYLPDGSFSLDDVRRRLDPHGVTLDLPTGEIRFVPDDPTFPTTLFLPTGRLQVQLDGGESPRLDQYIKELSAWLKVGFEKA
jgi:hypothetical protein